MSQLCAFLIAAVSQFSVTLVGQIKVSELILVGLGPILLLFRHQFLRVNYLPALMVLGGCWLGSQVLSDMVNGTGPSSFLRGWANIGIIIGMLAVYAMLFGDSTRVLGWYLVGLIPAGFYAAFIDRAEEWYGGSAETEFWDLFVTPWSMPLVLLVTWWLYPRRPFWSGFCLLAYSCASIAWGARAHGAYFLAGALLTLYAAWSLRTGFRLTQATLGRAALWAMPAAAVLFVMYVTLGLHGFLGEKTEAQLRVARWPYNPINVILVSRAEIYVAAYAIADKPVLGHGSWAYDPKYDAIWAEGVEQFTNMSVHSPRSHREELVIPVHSTIFGAWTFGGFLGAVFWVYVLWVAIRVLAFWIQRPWLPDLPVLCVFAAATYWHVFFSPMTFARGIWPPLMAFALVQMHSRLTHGGQVQQVVNTRPSRAS